MADEDFTTGKSSHSNLAQMGEILVKFDTAVARKINKENDKSWGFLIGGVKDDTFNIIGAMKCVDKYDILQPANNIISKLEKDALQNDIFAHLPEGVDIIGVFFGAEFVKHHLTKSTEQKISSFLGECSFKKSPANILIYKQDKEGKFESSLLNLTNENNHCQKITMLLDDSVGNKWMKDRLVFRLRGSITCEISIGKSDDLIKQECQRVINKIKDHPVALMFKDSNAIISKTTSNETWSDTIENVKKKNNVDCVSELRLLTSMCENSSLSGGDVYCPLLMFSSVSEEYLQFKLNLDTLVFAGKECSKNDFISRCVNALCIQAKHVILSTAHRNGNSSFQEMKAYHYTLDSLNHMITVVYPQCDIHGRKITDDDLVEKRKVLHELFLLPNRQPLLMKEQNHFHCLQSEYLINSHINLKSGIEDGICAIVNGRYAYHHYMQDRFNDDGWGCAYRSLQTICSWFKLQCFVNKPVPSHKEIQEALFAVGDKPKNFIGSKQWIGSFEVSLCLEKLIDVSSKILHVSTGAEMAYKGRELLDHFKNQGTPVMIGGGVLAHTILGVHFNESSGDIKFLILDPHYTGGENLKTIQDKGWCGWKGPKFWDQTVHYNMCLPQRPNKI
eukprot:gene12886-14212_t